MPEGAPLQKKIIIGIILNVLVISATLGIISYLAVRESIERSLQSRLALAKIISNYVEVVLNKNLDAYDRTRWIKRNATVLGDRERHLVTPEPSDGKPRVWS